MKRTASRSISASANKKQRASSSANVSNKKKTITSSSRGRGRGRGQAKGKKKQKSRSKDLDSDGGNDDGSEGDDDDDDDERLLQDITDRQEVVRQVTLASVTNRYDDLAQDLLSATVDVMEPSGLFSLDRSVPSLSSHNGNNGASGDYPRHHHSGDSDAGDDDVLQKPVHSLATWAMYSIVQHFHQLAAAANSLKSLDTTDVIDRDLYRDTGTDSHGQTRSQRRDLAARRAKRSARAIRDMPHHLSQKLFKLLRATRPGILSSRVWTRMFFAQPFMDTSMSAGGSGGVQPLYTIDLEGLDPSQVLDSTIQSRYFLRTPGVVGEQMESITLNGLTQLSDGCVAELVGACPNLRRLHLKACGEVGASTLAALPKDSLEELNISFVKGATVAALQRMMYECRELRVLKMVGLTNVRDVWLIKLKEAFETEQQELQSNGGGDPQGWPLQYLQNLKISHTTLGDRGLKVILGFCGRTLKRLDISSTNVAKVGMIGDYCTWEEGDENDDHASDRGAEEINPPIKARSGKQNNKSTLPRRTMLEKLNLTRVRVQSINELTKLFGAIPPGSFHTLLLGYLSLSSIPLRASDLVRLAPYFQAWTEAPRSSNTPSAASGASTMSTATSTVTWLGIRHDLDPNPFQYIHTLSFFGCTQLSEVHRHHHHGDGLLRVLSTLAPHLRRLELGRTNVRATQLHAILSLPVQGHPRSTNPADEGDDDDGVDEDGTLGTRLGQVAQQSNWVLEELGLDGCSLTDDMVDVLVQCRRLERLSLISARIDSQAIVERLVLACPRLKSLDLTGCRGIDLSLRRVMLQHVRSNNGV